MADQKYVVFKKEEWDQFETGKRTLFEKGDRPYVITDAVVLRLQDRFTKGALRAYLDQVLAMIDMFEDFGFTSPDAMANLGYVAEVFTALVDEADRYNTKIPD